MSGLPVQCPTCAARYLLPASLLGEAGASVRCPSCGHEFAVDAGGGVIPEGGADRLRNVARAVFDELAGKLGDALTQAASERRLFAEHGPAIMEAWDEFRRRAGSHASSRPFRDELRDRFGIELFPPGTE
ncbi:MAG: zinc-ribbon domain-containing protein [Candidatus Eisenbacteria bacterium]